MNTLEHIPRLRERLEDPIVTRWVLDRLRLPADRARPEGEASYWRCLELDPGNPEAARGLGRALREMKRKESSRGHDLELEPELESLRRLHSRDPLHDVRPEESAPVPIRSEKVGRNEPCPCGSGKKYKKCCGG